MPCYRDKLTFFLVTQGLGNIPTSQYVPDFPLSFFVVRLDGLLKLFGMLALPFAGRSSSGLVLFVVRQVPC